MPPSPSTGTRLRYPRIGHLGVWAIGGLVYFLAVLPFFGGPVRNLAAFKVAWTLAGWVLAEGLAWCYRRIGLANGGLGRAAAWVTAGSVLGAAAWVAALGLLSIAIQGNTLLFFTTSMLPFVGMNHVFILMAWSGGFLALEFRRRSQEEEKRSLEARSEARAAQLELLRQQMNPHFLFNALASLRALISEDPERARGMVTRLSGFLRQSLGGEDRTWVRVTDELELLRTYLEIERIRFGERLETVITESRQAGEATIPGLLLLSLVENAIKHGEPEGGRLVIRIEARIVRDALVLTVLNSGRLRPGSSKDGGFGLDNLRARLEGAYPGRHSLSLTGGNGCVQATITIHPEDGNP